MGESSIAPVTLNLSTRWWWVVRFVLWPPYPRERAPQTHCFGEGKMSYAVSRIKFWCLCCPAHSL